MPGNRSPNLWIARRAKVQAGVKVGSMRVANNFKICKRSNNSDDPVRARNKLRWAYDKVKIDPESGLEINEGKIDFDCRKAFTMFRVSAGMLISDVIFVAM